MQDSILTTVVKDIDGEVTTLEKFAGNVLLIVNVASKCGLTPQYEQLENIQKAWADRGFVVLGFPCNQGANRIRYPGSPHSQRCTLDVWKRFWVSKQTR